MNFIHYIPILTTIFTVYFTYTLFQHYRQRKSGYHILWWTFGVAAYGAGTLTESLYTLTGFSPFLFKTWYIAGALMGGAPLAQGTVYLFLKRRTAHILSGLLLTLFAFGSVVVILSPLDLSLVNPNVPQGDVLVWQWVRLISPFINTYAVIFLIGGAIVSAWRYHKHSEMPNRALGNALIAVGAILPGIGGAMSRAGYTEVLYVTEIIGILLIFSGYRLCTRETTPRDVQVGEPASVEA